MEDRWRDGEVGGDDIEQLVYLSNLIGGDPSLVQPGGGNTSVKLSEDDFFGCPARALVVKGSGTDLLTVGGEGFSHLYLDRLSLLMGRESMSDDEMMEFMRMAMLHPQRDPLPSVETPLHSVLPFKFIAHTHDVATLSLSDTPHAEEHVRRVYGDEVAFLEYVRPGFPLARRMVERCGREPPAKARGLVLGKHGLVVWGATARDCYDNLRAVIDKAEAHVAQRSKGKHVFGPPAAPSPDEKRRREIAAEVMPVIRGELARLGWRPVLHLDDSRATLDAITGGHFAPVASRGVMTPEHILRAGRKPLVFELGLELDAPSLKERVREQMRRFESEYDQYARAHGRAEPVADFLKVIVMPGVGIVCAGRDRRNALVAADCYRASLRAMAGAEAVDRFEFLSEADAFEMEHWPLERRKIEEGAKARRELEGKVAMVIGAASGIGRATALRFAEEGAHVVLADVDVDAAEGAASEVNARAPERALAAAVDVANSASVAAAFRECVLHFGGIDVLFYSPGVGPRFQSVLEMSDEEVEEKLAVHYRGAVAATREAARVMLDQDTGGRLIYNASKAAFVPGEGFAAYGASKAALVQYVRNVAAELGRHATTANYINADAVDTPMFRSVLKERGARSGKSEEEMLERYAARSTLGVATVPPEAVAEAALWLASDRSAYTNGCVITVGGGAEGFPR